MKKWLSGIILLVLVFSLAACGQTKATEGKEENKKIGSFHIKTSLRRKYFYFIFSFNHPSEAITFQ